MEQIVSSDSMFSLEDVLQTLQALSNEELFIIAHRIYKNDEPGMTVQELVEQTGQPEEQLRENIAELMSGHVIDTRMKCLVGEDCEGEEYELREFGRLAFEEGISGIVDQANTATVDFE